MAEITVTPTGRLGEKQALNRGRAYFGSYVRVSDRHDGTLPPSLDALKPDYLGQSVDTSFLTFHYPGGKLQPRDGRVIASEKQHDADHRFICIYGHRGVALLREGD